MLQSLENCFDRYGPGQLVEQTQRCMQRLPFISPVYTSFGIPLRLQISAISLAAVLIVTSETCQFGDPLSSASSIPIDLRFHFQEPQCHAVSSSRTYWPICDPFTP